MNPGKGTKRKNIKAGYPGSGVDSSGEEKALSGLLRWVNKTFDFRTGQGRVCLPVGFYANVLEIGDNSGLAFSTDGVGTKLIIAQMMNKYDTIGIDCVAMNANDIICVGAEPFSFVDYIAVQKIIPGMIEQIGKGLYEGARMANVNICGGEIAQVKEMIRGVRREHGFDIAGTCVGLVPLDRIIVGQDIEENDVIVGFKSSGIHSNGLTLARKILLKNTGFKYDKYFPELGRTLGEELLEPTRIYVPEVMEILRSNLKVKALLHITGDGLLNLTRVKASVRFNITKWPRPPAVFGLMQDIGQVSDAEMFKVFNMGIGFCLVVPKADAPKVITIAKKHGTEAMELGYTSRDRERSVYIEPKKLISKGSEFATAV
ncbi:MAG: phosphoribosylformylglycinamidine cyclo-ligase [Dehalococcoidia bacterium]|nr:phosphoribosylformylglycinamidine cyclo-ligase [Dehalococcoidia bacterium]